MTPTPAWRRYWVSTPGFRGTVVCDGEGIIRQTCVVWGSYCGWRWTTFLEWLKEYCKDVTVEDL